MESNIGTVANAIVDHEVAIVAADRAAAIQTSSGALRRELEQPAITEVLGQYGDVYELSPSGLSIITIAEPAVA